MPILPIHLLVSADALAHLVDCTDIGLEDVPNDTSPEVASQVDSMQVIMAGAVEEARAAGAKIVIRFHLYHPTPMIDGEHVALGDD